MGDISISPTSPVTNGALVGASNPLPVYLAGTASGTWAAKPSTPTTGQLYYATDAGAGGAMLRYNGTRWCPLNGTSIYASLDATSGNVANSETIKLQATVPAGLWQIGDRMRFVYTLTKSGTTDNGILRIRLGTAGTTSDQQLNLAANTIASANRVTAVIQDFRLESDTTVQALGPSGAGAALAGYSNTNTNAVSAAVTISSASNNALIFSIGILSSSTGDTVALEDAQIWWLAKAS